MRTIKLALLRKIMSKSTYQNRKEKGLCVQCGKKPPIEGKVMCAECAEQKKVYQRETREWRRNLGFCSRCGKNRIFGDEKECPECTAMMYEINQRNRERRNITAMDYYRKDIKRLKEQGLCRGCRTRKVAEGHTYCPTCLAKKREKSKERRRKQDKIGLERSERPNYGFCYTCGNPLDRDGRVCKKCAEIMASNLPRERYNANWRNDNKLVFKSN